MKKIWAKRFLAIILMGSMAIPSFPAGAKADAAESAGRAESVDVPEPYYEFTFDNVTAEGEKTVANEGSGGEANATIDGSKDGLGVIYDEERASKVLNLPGGDKNGATEGRLTLPDNMFQSVTNDGFAFSFWINIDVNAGPYSRIFSGTVNGQNSDNGGGNWDAPEFAFVAGGGDYVTTIVNSDKSVNTRLTWDSVFARGQWQHVTLSVSPAAYDVYLDGVKTETHVVANYTGLETLLAKLFADNAAELKKYSKCAIGSSVYKTDKDLKAKIDEFRFYNTALTQEQAKAAYDSYAVDESLLAGLQEKIDAAKAKSISFYTKESYAALKPAIEAGERGIANPTTAEYITGLTDNLQEALEGLIFYAGVTESTTFSDVQLAAENQAAKEIVSEGGLTSVGRQKILTAVEAADEALALEDESAGGQAAVDKALAELREAVDGLGEDDLAMPVISKQPVKAVYELGEPASPLAVEATVGVTGDEGGSLTYQWYQNSEKKTEGGQIIPGASGKTYTPSVEAAGRTYYYCEVTNTNAAIPQERKAINSNVVLVRVKGTEEAEVPQPYYEFTFDEMGDNGTEVPNMGSKEGAVARIEGTKEGLGIIEDEGRASKVLNLPGGDTNGEAEGRLSLPENMFADVTDAGFAFSFWINIDENASQYSRIFSGTVNGQNSDNGWPWEAPEFSFVAGSRDATDLGEGQTGYHTAVLLPDKTPLRLVWEEQFAKGTWQHVTISVSPESYDVYLDGELVGIKYDRNSNKNAVLQSLFADDAAILKQYVDCAIGSSVYKTDKDLKAKVDEFRFYNTYLTMEQAEAAYDSYAVDKSLVAELRKKVDEARDLNVSISFYTRESYEALLSAIAEGEQGIENPVTEEYVRGLISKLEAAIAGLRYYHESITGATTFSKVQLEDETDAAKTIIREGGLVPVSESAILDAIETAEVAARLTGTEANAQTTVDAALKALRTSVDAAVYEEAAATPQIANSGQPQNAVYTKGDTTVPVTPLTVEATVDDRGTLSYQWYRHTADSTAGGTEIEGADQAMYTPVITETGTVYYYCEVTNTQNKATIVKTAQVKSNAAAVTVKETEIPTIRAHGSDAVYKVGEAAAALTVEATVNDGGTLSYQWYKKTTKDAKGEAIAEASGKSYTPSTQTLGETYYYCVVTNTIGTAAKTAESSSVCITVVADKPAEEEGSTDKKDPEEPIKGHKAVNSITGVPAKMTVAFGKSVTLKAKGQGAVTYTSSDKKVLTIGKSSGKIKTVGYGKAQVTIKAAGNENYNPGIRKITVTIKPKKMAVSKVKSMKKATLNVTWKKDARADGYKIQYSTDRRFKKGVKTVTVKKNRIVKATMKKLKAGKKYYVRIRAYKGSGKNQVSGDWSKAKAVTVKKK